MATKASKKYLRGEEAREMMRKIDRDKEEQARRDSKSSKSANKKSKDDSNS